jgi:diadenosine tetraphosphate (Ap4A) HIT family hydrolase
MNPCELCTSPGGELLWQDDRCRVVRVGGAEGEAFPGFCRVIWQAHFREMSDLNECDRAHLRHVVDAVESVVRRIMNPDKINLASLGNVVPHLHWHVIPRWTNDSHFPAPIWATPCRPVPTRAVPASDALASALVAILGDSR